MWHVFLSCHCGTRSVNANNRHHPVQGVEVQFLDTGDECSTVQLLSASAIAIEPGFLRSILTLGTS